MPWDRVSASWDTPIVLDVVGIPQPQGSARAFRGKAGRPIITSDNRNLRAWRGLVAVVAQGQAPPAPLAGPIRVELAFRLPVPRSAPKRRRLPTSHA